MMSLSVVISTHNRAVSLARTLSSVEKFADEIIVVNSGSTDETDLIAKKYSARVFKRPNNVMLNVNKNFGFTKATGDWILNLDDDEDIPADLAEEIKKAIRTAPNEVAGFWIPRKNIIFGKWITHGLWWPDLQLRLFRRGLGSFAEAHVHEYISVSGSTQKLTIPFIHHNYDSISQYLAKMSDIYTENEVKKYESAKYLVSWTDAIRFPVSDFLKIYFAQQGYKDGLHGLVLAILQSFYSFIIFSKLWEKASFREIPISLPGLTREIRSAGKEYTYWRLTVLMKESSNSITNLWYKLMRRIYRP